MQQLLLMISTDVVLGQPGICWRWPLWCLWLWLVLKVYKWLKSASIVIVAGALFSGIWYWVSGPAFAWIGAMAVVLQSASLIWWWQPVEPTQRKSWGWH